ncbi:hypothetical protein BY996DRAFT_6879215, partial [Phakopsora pachyrhizi]
WHLKKWVVQSNLCFLKCGFFSFQLSTFIFNLTYYFYNKSIVIMNLVGCQMYLNFVLSITVSSVV